MSVAAGRTYGAGARNCRNLVRFCAHAGTSSLHLNVTVHTGVETTSSTRADLEED